MTFNIGDQVAWNNDIDNTERHGIVDWVDSSGDETNYLVVEKPSGTMVWVLASRIRADGE